MVGDALSYTDTKLFLSNYNLFWFELYLILVGTYLYGKYFMHDTKLFIK